MSLNPMYQYPQMMAMDSLIRDIEKAANGEYHAIQTYERLLQLAPTTEDREVISKILEDERKHFAVFTTIYRQFTGNAPALTPTHQLPASFISGIVSSIPDELEDSKFYQNISEHPMGESLRRIFLNASHDEQRHATWFTYLWIRHQR